MQPDRLKATLALDEQVERVRLVSTTTAESLHKLGIFSIRDLLNHFPRRYIDLSSKESIASSRIGKSCTIEGVIHQVTLKRPKPRLPLVEITLVDETGTLMVTCFRQPWLANQLQAGMRVAMAGKLEFNYGFKRMVNPYIEVLEGGAHAEGIIIPVHPASEKVSAVRMRRLVSNAFSLTSAQLDPLPLNLRLRYRLMSRQSALYAIHFPHSMQELHEARRRLVYEELLMLELLLMREGNARAQGKTPVQHCIKGEHLQRLVRNLPFVLTEEQSQAVQSILDELAAPRMANHMLLGDVGTGKTVVAAHALAAVADTHSQALLMAPTEVLAKQHAQSLGSLFNEAGVSWDLLTGSTSSKERAGIIESLSEGSLDVLIGTHALLEEDVCPKKLSLVIIDEQQRFGVEQRNTLLLKGEAVDALYLTATPIPRSLALALFANTTLSYIKTRPFTLAERKTFVHTKEDRGKAYDAAKEALARNEQVYVVCPLIGQDADERNERANDEGRGGRNREIDEEASQYASISIESDADLHGENLAAATQEAKYLQSNIFADWQVELLHGRMPSAEKQAVMERFRAGEVQVLVATTVIEVGVDVPQATVMIVEDADRFGLSQLHQLRGRVGRGSLASQVHLVSASQSETALKRLAALEKTDDGFELAQYDLSLRREGDILGNRQSGTSGLKLVNIVRDARIIEAAHADAAAILEEDPLLKADDHRALLRELNQTYIQGKTKGGA